LEDSWREIIDDVTAGAAVQQRLPCRNRPNPGELN
jgi:hypothetical protein